MRNKDVHAVFQRVHTGCANALNGNVGKTGTLTTGREMAKITSHVYPAQLRIVSSQGNLAKVCGRCIRLFLAIVMQNIAKRNSSIQHTAD
jgi:hypothetical protein